MEAKYVVTFEVANEVIWIQNFLLGLRVVLLAVSPLVLFCDNNGVVVQIKEPRNHRKGEYIEKKYHLIHKIVMKGDVAMKKIASTRNLINPFMKTLPTRVFDGHRDNLGIRYIFIML